jgi:hypothetical protein
MPAKTYAQQSSIHLSFVDYAVFCDLKKRVGDVLMFSQDYIRGRLERLNQVSTGVQGWKLVVDYFNANELCSGSDIFNIEQMKSKYMSISLHSDLEEMNAWQ